MVAGNPKIYAQLVQMLSEYSRVIKDDEPKPEADTDAASSQPRTPRVKTAPASTSAIDGTAGSLFANTPTGALARSMAAGIGADMAAAEALQEAAATAAQNAAEQEPAEAPARKATRIRKADMPAPEPEAPVRKRAPRDDAPF
jgi:myo-inositol-1(or 4)-monophosphatase